MPSVLPSPGDCCQSSCDEAVSVQVPGPAGEPGADGADGAAGSNAFTTVTLEFEIPAVGDTVLVQVTDSSWMAAGQKLFIQNAGYFEFVSSSASTNATVKNMGYTGNSAPGVLVAADNKVSPGGVAGSDGADGADGATTNVPLTTKGDLLTYDTNFARLGVGANGKILTADSAQPKGLRWGDLDLSGANSSISGALPIANGGTGQATATLGFNAISPVTTRGDIIVRGATNNQRLAVGAANTGLFSDGTDPSWRKLVQADILAGGPMSRNGLLGFLIGADFNTTLDQAITILSGVTRYIIDKIVVDNASTDFSAGTVPLGGVYGAAAKSAPIIVAAAQSYVALTAANKFKELTLEAVVGTDVMTAGTLYFSLSTAHGAAGTANIWIFGRNLT